MTAIISTERTNIRLVSTVVKTVNAPYMGRLWEACVKSVKYHLHKVMETECLTFEEVATLLSQIEALSQLEIDNFTVQ